MFCEQFKCVLIKKAQKLKKTFNLTVFFAFLGPARPKAAFEQCSALEPMLNA
jgi:hypothetical protein